MTTTPHDQNIKRYGFGKLSLLQLMFLLGTLGILFTVLS